MAITALTLSSLMAVAANVKVKTVETRFGHVRQGPSYAYDVVAKVPQGHRFEILEEDHEWNRVEVPDGGATGWVVEDQLTGKELILTAPDKATRRRMKSDQVAMAVRSFQDAVEKHYRLKHPRMEPFFAWLDGHAADAELNPRMEEIARFRSQGGLVPLGGLEP